MPSEYLRAQLEFVRHIWMPQIPEGISVPFQEHGEKDHLKNAEAIILPVVFIAKTRQAGVNGPYGVPYLAGNENVRLSVP